jgi:hypothetical protein
MYCCITTGPKPATFAGAITWTEANATRWQAKKLTGIMAVVVGTQDAFHALQTDAQVASRFEPLLIPRWTATDAFRAFIVAYGKLLPLRKASPFGEPAMIQTLIMHSSGVTGRVTWLLGRARGTGDREWQ